MAVAGCDPDDDDVRAGSDSGRVAAEVGAESQRPPQRAACGFPLPATRSATRGDMVATYGMLSTMPDRTAEPKSRPVAAAK